jgi:hypothetical protein
VVRLARPATAKDVPAGVELCDDGVEVCLLVGLQGLAGVTLSQAVLFGDQLLYVIADRGDVHQLSVARS